MDAKQIGLEGHSRYGKATLVAMAYEPRLAIAYVSSSGEGGAKLYRHIFGEQVGNVAGTSEYHWMAGNFLKYAGPLTPGDMPVDAHELIAHVRAATGLYFRRRDQRGRMGGRQGDVSGGCRRGAGLSAAGQAGHGDDASFRRSRRR